MVLKLKTIAKRNTNKRTVKAHLQIRKPTNNDIPELTRNWYSYLEEAKTDLYFGLGVPNKRPTKAEFTSRYKKDLKQMKKGDAVLLVAESNSRVVDECGVYAVRPDTDRSHVGGLDMSIIKAYRNMGIGTALLDKCLKQSRKRFELVTTELNVRNRASIRLIEKFGFKIAGRIPHDTKRKRKYLDTYIAYLLMR